MGRQLADLQERLLAGGEDGRAEELRLILQGLVDDSLRPDGFRERFVRLAAGVKIDRDVKEMIVDSVEVFVPFLQMFTATREIVYEGGCLCFELIRSYGCLFSYLVLLVLCIRLINFIFHLLYFVKHRKYIYFCVCASPSVQVVHDTLISFKE